MKPSELNAKKDKQPLLPEHKALGDFYNVDNYTDLVNQQSQHIARLQHEMVKRRESCCINPIEEDAHNG